MSNRNPMRNHRIRARWPQWAFALVITVSLCQGAWAQRVEPRIGLSASRDHYVNNITVERDSSFTLYAMVFGATDGVPLDQTLSTIPWVIHQVCCGAVLNITAIDYNPELDHTGFPLAGTVSTAPGCTAAGDIWLATITAQLTSTEAGDYEWAAGPFGQIRDCDDAPQFVSGLAVTVSVDGTVTPTESNSWGTVKASYR